MKNVRSSQASVSISFCTELSKTQFSSVSIISNTSIRNTRLKLVKNEANAKQLPEFLLVENYLHFSSKLSSKNNSTYCKN